MAIQKSEAFTALIRAGIEWPGVQQDPAARLSPLGIGVRWTGGQPLQIDTISLTANSYAGRPVIVFDCAYGEDHKTGASYQYELTDPDVFTLAEMVTEAGGQIASHWNGVYAGTVSFSLWNIPDPSLIRAVDNHRGRLFHEYPDLDNPLTYPVGWR